MTERLARALILDFGGVVTKTLFETHAHTEQELGLKPGTLQWRGPFDPQSDPLWRSMLRHEITERDYWLTRAREVGRLLGENWDSMQDLVRRARGHRPQAIIRPEAEAAVRAVHESGAKLAILSNELDLFYGADFRERMPILPFFDTIVDATYTGVLKPDPRAYALVLEAVGEAPGDCVFVDDQQRNIDGAVAVGLRTVRFDVGQPGASFREALGHFRLSHSP
ncbi:MAG TPA: HAD-IA family hydrolase [Gammaproteobacteria bacterium]|nr:HAD-IA family hydrolase [Gammaproteobacteria bacterium]